VESHGYPAGLRAVSPDGGVYAAVVNDKLCINNWADVSIGCPLAVGGVDTVDAEFSVTGGQLGVVLTKTGNSTVWVIDMTTGLARVLGQGGLTPDANAATVLSISAEVWDVDEQTFLVQTAAAAGAGTADLIGVPVDGSTPASLPIRADVADSFPSLAATSTGILYSPNTGPATGQMWWLNSRGTLSQVGSDSFSDGGTVILVAVSPTGESALICPAHNAEIGELAQVDLATGEVIDYLKDTRCDGAAYSPDGKFVVVAGPVNDDNVLTVFDNNTPDVMVSVRLDGGAQNTPGSVTWNSDSLLTVVPADGTAAGARVNVVQLVTH
jgi:WD40 repeat protein